MIYDKLYTSPTRASEGCEGWKRDEVSLTILQDSDEDLEDEETKETTESEDDWDEDEETE